MFYAGLDWANDHHDVVVIDEAGTKLASKRVAHSKAGLDELTQFLESFTGPKQKDQLACIAETNRGLLIAAVLEVGFSVYPVNPKVADRRRSASGAKTDQIDAYLLAKLGRAELADLRKLQPDSAIIAELKELKRDQDALVQMQTRLINQLTACLKAYYPVALKLFTKLQQPSTLIFLQTYPTPQVAQEATVVQIEQVLKGAGHPTAHKVASKIHGTLHQPQLTADVITTRTKSRLALALIAQLLPLLEQIAAYEKEIEALFLTHADSQIGDQPCRRGKTTGSEDARQNWEMIAPATRLAPNSKRWPEPPQCSTRVATTRKHIVVMPASSLCVMRSISWPAPVDNRNGGPTSSINANGRKARVIRWRCVRFPMCGCAFSIACGLPARAMILRSLLQPGKPMLHVLRNQCGS